MKYFIVALSLLALFASGCAGENELAKSAKKDDKKLLQKAEDLYARKKYVKALAILDKIRYTTSVVADDAHLLTAKVYIGQHEYELAVSELKWLLGQYPNSDKLQEGAFLLGEAYRLAAPRAELDQEYTQKALAAYQDFLDRYPTSDFADSANARIAICRAKLAHKIYLSAELYYKLHQDSAAVIYINNLRSEYSDTKWKFWADYLEALVRIRQGNKIAAKTLLKDVLANNPEDKLRKKAEKKLKKI